MQLTSDRRTGSPAILGEYSAIEHNSLLPITHYPLPITLPVDEHVETMEYLELPLP